MPTAKWSRAHLRAHPRNWVSEPLPPTLGPELTWRVYMGQTRHWGSAWVHDYSGDVSEGEVVGEPKSEQLEPGPRVGGGQGE